MKSRPARNNIVVRKHHHAGTGKSLPHDTSAKCLPDATSEFLRSILQQAHSDNTRKAYGHHLRYWWSYAAEAFGVTEHYPVSVDKVLRFISDHLGTMDKDLEARLIAKGIKNAPGPHSLNTVIARLTVLGIAHKLREVEDPCKDPMVKQVLRNAKRAFGQNLRRKKAMTTDVLEKVLATCDKSLVGLRDRALLLLAFSSGGRRRSEVIAFEVRDLTPVKENYVLLMRKSKTDQAGKGVELPLIGVAAKAVRDWLKAARIREGRIFRGILPGNRITGSLSGRQVSRIVKKRIALAGLDPAAFSAHSLRSGFMTSAGRAGINLPLALQMSTHKSGLSGNSNIYFFHNLFNNKTLRLGVLARSE